MTSRTGLAKVRDSTASGQRSTTSGAAFGFGTLFNSLELERRGQGSLDGPVRLVRTSFCMAAPTPSLQWCIPRWSTSLAGRNVRSAMMTKCQAQHCPRRSDSSASAFVRKHSASALTWCFARVIGPGRICCGAGVVVGQAGAGSGGIQGWSRMASRRACSAL